MALLLLKVAITGACLYYIYTRLSETPAQEWNLSQWLMDGRFQVGLTIICLMVPINWYLEIMKWRRCIRPITEASRSFAAAAVLRGLALNWIIPFGLGDFMGRMLGIPPTKASLEAVVVCRAYALGVTSLMGVWALLYLYHGYASYGLAPGMIALLVAWVGVIHRDPLYSWQDHGAMGLFTLLRYAVFFLQLFVLLAIVAPELAWATIAAGIAAVFLIRSIVPSLLGALGVREAAIVFIFAPYVPDATPLLIASFSLWVVNIVLPSLAGVGPLLAYRFKPSL